MEMHIYCKKIILSYRVQKCLKLAKINFYLEIKAKLFKAIDEILIGLSADPILIAVSGGVDSMVLADCLNKKEYQLQLHIVTTI